MNYLYIALIIIAAASFTAVIIMQLRRKPRTAAIKEIGANIDLEFQEKNNIILDRLKFFKIYDPLTLQVVAKNVLCAKSRSPEVWIFDYDAIVAPSNAPSRVSQTVFYFRDPRMKVPGFRMFPKKSDIFKRNDTVFKYRPISFSSNPQFSEVYKLVGPDDMEIKDLFKPDLLAYFEKLKDIHIEGFETEVILYHYKKIISPKDFYRCYHNAQSIFQLFLHHSAIFRAAKIGLTPFE